jgi:uncharacterized protein
MHISELYIYPIKSLGGYAVQQAIIEPTGFKHDRRWMLVNANNICITQRDTPNMALLQTAETPTGIVVYHKQQPNNEIAIPMLPSTAPTIQATVWDDTCAVQVYNAEINQWFSKQLNIDCKLVYMPNNTSRLVDNNYAANNEITAFTDGYPILILGQASLDFLNQKLKVPLPANRFRPNIVFTGGHPHAEDEMAEFTINNISFLGVKPSARCNVTTINQQTAKLGKEPLKTLATYRFKNNKIYFGQNVLHQQLGSIQVGNHIQILTKNPPFI